MEIPFKDDVATRHNAWAPSEDLGDEGGRVEVNSILDTQMTNEHDGHGLGVESEECEEIGDPKTNPSQSNQRPKRKRASKDNKRGSVGHRMCEQFDHVIESFNSDSSVVADKTTNVPTIADCLDILKQLSGLEYGSETHILGIRLMKSKTNRETFVLLDDPVLQLNWIKSHTMTDVSRQ